MTLLMLSGAQCSTVCDKIKKYILFCRCNFLSNSDLATHRIAPSSHACGAPHLACTEICPIREKRVLQDHCRPRATCLDLTQQKMLQYPCPQKRVWDLSNSRLPN